MIAADETAEDIELRSIDPARNRFRVFGITECVTLFGEHCLRIVWGRAGNRRMRERSEVFADRTLLQRRREELLRRRRSHGYETTLRAAAQQRARERAVAVDTHAVERAIVEHHGLSLREPVVRQLVTRWHAATLELARFLKERRTEVLDLVDVSTLAAMFVAATAAA